MCFIGSCGVEQEATTNGGWNRCQQKKVGGALFVLSANTENLEVYQQSGGGREDRSVSLCRLRP